MKLNPTPYSRRLPRRPLLVAALCALLGCLASGVTPTMRAPQSGGPRALVRRGLSLNGRVEGSVQQLTGEDTTLNGGAALTGDLLVPGSPSLRQNGHPTFGGVAQGGGGAQPSNYRVTLNEDARLGRLLTRTDPVTIPPVALPAATTGTRDVVIGSPEQSAGDFSTVRDLTLNAGADAVAVPPGNYRRLTANSHSKLVLGVAGASEPAVYILETLTLNDFSVLQVDGPVVLTTAGNVTLAAVAGSASHPLWLNLRVASGGVTLNTWAALYGSVTVPSGAVVINRTARLQGRLACDRLTVNEGGLLKVVE
jgi:rhamnogalacturonan endolyase